jgi:5'-3' exonuclease
MILIDFSAISISAIVVQKVEVDENMIRHMILNSIRMYTHKYSKKYGQVVLACDASTWRRDYYPQYKANRRKDRSESSTDWDEMFRIINMVLDEIRENMPYKVLHIKGCEADDIIGTLAEYTQEFGKNEPIMIISGDKDFIQLQQYPNVEQYSPIQKKFLKHDDPKGYLLEHVFRGDSSDGVPNILSHDDTFVNGDRQSPVTAKKIKNWVDNINNLESVMSTEEFKNYARNRKLIDLTQTPQELKEKIVELFESQTPVNNSKVLPYLISKRCKQLIGCIEEFYPCQ